MLSLTVVVYHFRPKKIICLFALNWISKIGSVGRKKFFFYLLVFFSRSFFQVTNVALNRPYAEFTCMLCTLPAAIRHQQHIQGTNIFCFFSSSLQKHNIAEIKQNRTKNLELLLSQCNVCFCVCHVCSELVSIDHMICALQK